MVEVAPGIVEEVKKEKEKVKPKPI